MAGSLSPSNLYWVDPGATDWNTRENTNIELLNSTLLKLSGLADVTSTGYDVPDSILKRTVGAEWQSEQAPYAPEIMTTTTSTTTT